MKTLYLLRHGKSSWSDDSLADRERPLKERGHTDAALVAAHISSRHSAPEVVCSSDAVRTLETLPPFLEAWNLKKKQVSVHSELYLASQKNLVHFIKDQNDKNSALLLVGHNPGLTDLYNALVRKKDYIKNLSTCGFAALRLDIRSWKHINSTTANVHGVYQPKELRA